MNLIILGPQGSGKGTQAERLAQKFDLEHIDMGKFLREVAKIDTPIGKEIYKIQNVTKTLVPSRILKEVFTIKLGSLSRERGIIFDGFPRNLDQAKYFENALVEFGRNIDALIYVKISEKESIERISKRWVCQNCRSVFIMGENVKSPKEKCPKCQGIITQRTDDTEEGIKKRLRVFREETFPVIDYFRCQGLVIKINGEQSIEKVFKEILEKVGNS